MADIVFRYQEMRSAANQVAEIAERYKNAAERFETDFLASISNWEGESKDKLEAFITGAVNEYIATTVPNIVTALSELLLANAEQMEKADQQIAENIPTSLG